ncbi:MAG: hypothetical protein ACLP2J_00030, partial [Acidimicrobiales bacterium]
MIETLAQTVSGAEIVEIVARSEEAIPGINAEAWAAPGSEGPAAHIRRRVLAQLAGDSGVKSFSCLISGVAWGALVEPVQAKDDGVMGALVVARQGRAWSKRERSLV